MQSLVGATENFLTNKKLMRKPKTLAFTGYQESKQAKKGERLKVPHSP